MLSNKENEDSIQNIFEIVCCTNDSDDEECDEQTSRNRENKVKTENDNEHGIHIID